MIEVVRGELATSGLPCLLRPVTAEWTAVTPAMARFESLLSEDVREQCRRMGELPVGSAIVTAAGGLEAELLIHVIVRSMTEPVSVAGVERALDNGLRRADEWGVAALALPPLGTGAGNLDAEEAADVMVPILHAWLRADRRPRRVVVVVGTDYEHDVFERRRLREPPAPAGTDLPLLDL